MKHIIMYFLVFIMIIGLTSTFIAKEFMDQAREISLMGEDMLQMQASLNNANISKKQSQLESNTVIENQEEESVEDVHRELFENGDSHEKIMDYQKILVQLEYLDSEPDGSFGHMTQEAVKNFQAKENLEETGKLDIETQKSLEKAEKLLAQNTEQTEQAEQTKQTEHIVKANETLSKISEQYGVSLKDIYQANNLTETSTISIGQKIIIPHN